MRSLSRTRGPIVAALLSLSALLVLAASPCRAEGPWPRRFDSTAGTFVVYQPQPEALQGDILTGRMAFSLQKPSDTAPKFGVLWFQSVVLVDRDSSTVEQRDLDVTLVRMPGIRPEDAKTYENLVETEAKSWDLTGSLDELQAGLAATAKEQASIEGLEHKPPRIIFTYQRSLLVLYDGSPVLEPIAGTQLERVSNTPYAVVYAPDRRTYFLSGANLWYAANDPLGPWAVTSNPPADVVAAVPPDTSTGDRVQGALPVVVTATEPTELVSFDGEPLLAPLVGDRLLYATNTESDVLREVDTNTIYVLLSGRWYSASSEKGPWTYVPPDRLPDAFRGIPPDSPKAGLLASIAGTGQANDAVADAEIPTTTAIRRDDHGVSVAWDGSPQFERIPGTSLQYGVNTDGQVLFDGRRYFFCDQGVWYVADRPDGPWAVSVDVPAGIDDLPPSCPVYNLRWVYIYEVTPDIVYVGYLPGYLGCYPYRGVVVYGSGYRYKPWRGRHHYFPRYPTWGYYARYNPWLSYWSFGYSYGSGFLRIGMWWWPGHGQAHRRGYTWFGPGGYRRPWLGGGGALARSRPQGQRNRPIDSAPIGIYSRAENSGRIVRFKRPSEAPIVNVRTRPPTLPNDIYAGRDGKVYQRGAGGQWKVNDGSKWLPAKVPVAPAVPSGPAGSVGETPRFRPPPSHPMPMTPAAPPGREGTPRVTPPPPQPPPSRPPAPPPSPRPSPPGGTEPMWRPREVPRPAPPTPTPSPGSLEREFEARRRAAEKPGPAAPSPRPPQPEKKPGNPPRKGAN